MIRAMNFSLVSEFSKYVADLLKCKFLSKLYVFTLYGLFDVYFIYRTYFGFG